MASSSVIANNQITTHSSIDPSTTSSSSAGTPNSNLLSKRKRSYDTAISMPTAHNPSNGTMESSKASSSSPADDLMSIKVDASITATTLKDYARTISQSDADGDDELVAVSTAGPSAFATSPTKATTDNLSLPPPAKYPTIKKNSGSSDLQTICKPAPFSTDEEAIIERDATDYTQKITYQMARSGQTKRRVRVYADGVYDLFHQGHARQLMQAKNIFPNVYLIVGVCNDELTHSMKGRTVMNDFERYEGVRHCRYVDEIIQNAPWTYSDEFITSNKIDFVAHDDIPYAFEGMDDIYGPLKAKGMFVATERTEGVSTSDIVARIVKDYDLYVRRNLARGYSAKDLNVSFLSEKKFRWQNKMDELKDRGRRELTKVKGDIMTKWEEKSREFIDAFLLLFGRERLHNLWNESKGKLIQALSPPGSPSGSISGDYDDDFYDDDDEDSDVYADVPPEANAMHMEHSPRARRSYHRRVLDSPTTTSRRAAPSHEHEEHDEQVEFERKSN